LIGIVEPESFAFYLNVRGGYGKLYGNQLGKILGALVGLEKAAAPFLVRLVDPLIVNGRDKHIQQMATLRSYLQGRRMKLELVAHTGLETAVDAEAFVAGKAVHMLHLDLPQMGSMDEAITAAQICQQHDISVLWGGSPEETALAARLSVHAALAVQPTLLLVKFGRLGRSGISLTSNEMNRILASATAVP
jgi:methylaspartate ammonia-lyase